VSYRPEPEVDGEDPISVKTFSFALLVAPLIGLFLLLAGLAGGGHVMIALGALMLAASPFIVRWVWRGGLWD
jgi:hypothetical protein